MSAAVACTNLTKRFGDLVAVDAVDLAVVKGEVFGLLGPNGAGKSTTIRMIATLTRPDSGRVEVMGRDTAAEPMAARRLLGYVPQQLSAEAALSGRENVELFARLYDVPRRLRRARVDAVLEMMGLADAADRVTGTYSGGMIRRLELAQALVGEPSLLVLDEPTIGLDPMAREGLWQRVAELRRATALTVLITTHYMEEADEACDRVALMDHGRIVEVGRPADLKASLGTGATLDDVFRHHTGGSVEGGDLRDVVSVRRTAHRLG